MAATGSVAVFCPTSNLFLGSGLYDKVGLREKGVRRAIATDVGGGTNYSMLRTLDEGYKVLALRGQKLDPLKAFWWITRGNAEALSLADRIGTLDARRRGRHRRARQRAPPRRWRCAWKPSARCPRSSSCSRPSATTAPSPRPTSPASAGPATLRRVGDSPTLQPAGSARSRAGTRRQTISGRLALGPPPSTGRADAVALNALSGCVRRLGRADPPEAVSRCRDAAG